MVRISVAALLALFEPFPSLCRHRHVHRCAYAADGSNDRRDDRRGEAKGGDDASRYVEGRDEGRRHGWMHEAHGRGAQGDGVELSPRRAADCCDQAGRIAAVHLGWRRGRLDSGERLDDGVSVRCARRHEPRVAGLEAKFLSFQIELGAACDHIADRLVFSLRRGLWRATRLLLQRRIETCVPSDISDPSHLSASVPILLS